jgi:hypothetical protein
MNEQYMVFTARIHQFHSDLAEGMPKHKGRSVQDIVSEELQYLSDRRLKVAESEGGCVCSCIMSEGGCVCSCIMSEGGCVCSCIMSEGEVVHSRVMRISCLRLQQHAPQEAGCHVPQEA